MLELSSKAEQLTGIPAVMRRPRRLTHHEDLLLGRLLGRLQSCLLNRLPVYGMRSISHGFLYGELINPPYLCNKFHSGPLNLVWSAPQSCANGCAAIELWGIVDPQIAPAPRIGRWYGRNDTAQEPSH